MRKFECWNVVQNLWCRKSELAEKKTNNLHSGIEEQTNEFQLDLMVPVASPLPPHSCSYYPQQLLRRLLL